MPGGFLPQEKAALHDTDELSKTLYQGLPAVAD
jgi:hypothetical protein